MANTVSGLFPELAGALAANPLADAYKPVADPLASYAGLIGGTGAQLRQSIGQAFGQQTPQEQLRNIVQSVQQRADLGTPEGLVGHRVHAHLLLHRYGPQDGHAWP
jgi:hypothetical protein